MATLSREIPLGAHTALLVVDAQNYCWVRNRGLWQNESDGAPSPYYWRSVENAKTNIAALLRAARRGGLDGGRLVPRAERIFTVIEALTADARDHSLDYKISGLRVTKGSWEAQVVDALEPLPDEVVLPKGSSSVFVSTNITYVLRNLGVEQLVICGGLTDQCVESAVRDACDEGFLVTLATDACVTHSEERHEASLRAVAGVGVPRPLTFLKIYCRQRTTAEIVAELSGGPSGTLDAKARALLAASTAPHAYVRFEVVDFNGKSLSKTVLPASESHRRFSAPAIYAQVPARHAGDPVDLYSGAISMGANARVQCFPEKVRDGCPNWRLRPDWATLQRLPWASSPERDVFRVCCEQAFAPTPRFVCRGALDALRLDHGLELLAASELEFVVTDAERRPLFDGVDIFATLQLAKTDFAYAVAEQITTVDVRTMNCEYGAGQLEITFKPKRGLAAADCAHTFKTGVKELAMRRGLAATFASKPFGGPRGVGNGGHLNVSLWRGDDPVTHGDEDGLSPTARHFIAGVLAHARGLEALAAPTPGCYARHGNWAPTHANWGHDDRTICVRVKSRGCAPGEAYVEYRAPSASANTYLVLAGLAAAGADGVKRELVLPPAKDDEAAALPTSLPEALSALRADEVLVEALGKDFVEWYTLVKDAELADVAANTAKFAATGLDHDAAVQEAWNSLYFEFV